MKCNVQTQFNPTGKMRKAMLAEIRSQLTSENQRYMLGLESVMLYTLHKNPKLRWGKQRLEEFYREFIINYEELKARFEEEDGTDPAYYELLKIGIDVKELQKKYGQ
jgi:hypothetical protein